MADTTSQDVETSSVCDLCGQSADPAAEECMAVVCVIRCHQPREHDVYHSDCLKKFLRSFSRMDVGRCSGFHCPKGKGKGTQVKHSCPAKVSHSQRIIIKNNKNSTAAQDAIQEAAAAEGKVSKKDKAKGNNGSDNKKAAPPAKAPKAAVPKLPALNKPRRAPEPYLPTEIVRLPPVPDKPKKDPLGRNTAAAAQAAAACAKAAKKNARRAAAKAQKRQQEQQGFDSEPSAATRPLGAESGYIDDDGTDVGTEDDIHGGDNAPAAYAFHGDYVDFDTDEEDEWNYMAAVKAALEQSAAEAGAWSPTAHGSGSTGGSTPAAPMEEDAAGEVSVTSPVGPVTPSAFAAAGGDAGGNAHSAWDGPGAPAAAAAAAQRVPPAGGTYAPSRLGHADKQHTAEWLTQQKQGLAAQYLQQLLQQKKQELAAQHLQQQQHVGMPTPAPMFTPVMPTQVSPGTFAAASGGNQQANKTSTAAAPAVHAAPWQPLPAYAPTATQATAAAGGISPLRQVLANHPMLSPNAAAFSSVPSAAPPAGAQAHPYGVAAGSGPAAAGFAPQGMVGAGWGAGATAAVDAGQGVAFQAQNQAYGAGAQVPQWQLAAGAAAFPGMAAPGMQMQPAAGAVPGFAPANVPYVSQAGLLQQQSAPEGLAAQPSYPSVSYSSSAMQPGYAAAATGLDPAASAGALVHPYPMQPQRQAAAAPSGMPYPMQPQQQAAAAPSGMPYPMQPQQQAAAAAPSGMPAPATNNAGVFSPMAHQQLATPAVGAAATATVPPMKHVPAYNPLAAQQQQQHVPAVPAPAATLAVEGTLLHRAGSAGLPPNTTMPAACRPLMRADQQPSNPSNTAALASTDAAEAAAGSAYGVGAAGSIGGAAAGVAGTGSIGSAGRGCDAATAALIQLARAAVVGSAKSALHRPGAAAGNGPAGPNDASAAAGAVAVGNDSRSSASSSSGSSSQASKGYVEGYGVPVWQDEDSSSQPVTQGVQQQQQGKEQKKAAGKPGRYVPPHLRNKKQAAAPMAVQAAAATAAVASSQGSAVDGQATAAMHAEEQAATAPSTPAAAAARDYDDMDLDELMALCAV